MTDRVRKVVDQLGEEMGCNRTLSSHLDESRIYDGYVMVRVEFLERLGQPPGPILQGTDFSTSSPGQTKGTVTVCPKELPNGTQCTVSQPLPDGWLV